MVRLRACTTTQATPLTRMMKHAPGFRDAAAQDTHLPGPARAMSHRANADIDFAADRDHRDGDVVWATARDVYANRTVTIPEPVRAGLVDATDILV